MDRNPFLHHDTSLHETLYRVLQSLLCIVALVLLSLANAGNVWVTARGMTKTSAGLWRSCAIDIKCEPIQSFDDNHWLLAVRILTLVAIALNLSAFAMSLCGIRTKSIRCRLVSIQTFVATSLEVAALTIYMKKVIGNKESHYGWCYFIGWAGALLDLIATLIGLLFEYKLKKSKRKETRQRWLVNRIRPNFGLWTEKQFLNVLQL